MITTNNQDCTSSCIAVPLVGEGIDVWVLAQCKQIRDSVFLILESNIPGETEEWKFNPGEIVVCEKRSLRFGANRVEKWVAIERANV